MATETQIIVHDLRDRQGYTLQKAELKSLDGKDIASAEMYTPAGVVTTHWRTLLTDERLVDLVEQCVRWYETSLPQDVLNISGETEDQRARAVTEELVDSHEQGIIVYSDIGDTQTEVQEIIGYERPFTLSALTDISGDNRLAGYRINTPIGDFSGKEDISTDESEQFGIYTHIQDMRGFAKLISESSQVPVSEADALNFLSAVVALYQI